MEYAVYMAFNHQKYVPRYGYMGGTTERGANRSFTPLVEFFREYDKRYFTDTKNVADVAVLRSWPSMAYSIWPTLVPTILIEQVLIQHKVPFDIIFDEQIETVDRYQAIILPGQENLSAAIIDRLAAYVRGGGTLVFTGNTANFNQWRERRAANPLKAMMGLSSSLVGITVRRHGKGRMVFIPQLLPDIPGRSGKTLEIGTGNRFLQDATSSSGRPFPSKLWLLPKNHCAIHSVIVKGLSHGLSIETEAPLTTVMELLTRDKSRETIVHFINFDQQNPLAPFRATLKKQFEGGVKSVSFVSPEFEQPLKLEFEDSGEEITLTVPSLQLYSMVVVSQ